MTVQEPDLTFEEQRARAIALIHRKGLRLAIAEPAPVRLLRKCGVQVRPLPFESFARITVISGAWFGFWWGCLMWLLRWRGDAAPWFAPLVAVLCAGLVFGLSNAAWFAWLRNKHQLPRWDALQN